MILALSVLFSIYCTSLIFHSGKKEKELSYDPELILVTMSGDRKLYEEQQELRRIREEEQEILKREQEYGECY